MNIETIKNVERVTFGPALPHGPIFTRRMVIHTKDGRRCIELQSATEWAEKVLPVET